MTFGYNGNFIRSNTRTSTTVLDFAKDLLYELKYAQDEKNEALGIGDAYIQGQYDPKYKEIVDAISAIIFLSTPHRGTNLADTLNRILQASIISSPKQFITELTRNSFTIQKLNEQFRHIAPKLDIISFYETQMTPIGSNRNKIMVLEKDSSVLGYPGEISKALDADHNGVCKFDSPNDPLYINVRNVLKSLVSRFPTPGSGSVGVRSKHEDLREIKAFLVVSETPESDYMFFRDRWLPDTCGWVLDDAEFKSWLYDTSSRARILWLHGAAASGKSILSSFIINHLVQLGLSCQYFYVRFSDESKRSSSALLRSLAFQISQNFPAFRQAILRQISEGSKLDIRDAQTIWNRIFRSILFKIRQETRLFWIVDGLEESDDAQAFIRFISDLNLALFPIRFLIVSRKTQALTTSFKRLPNNIQFNTIQYEGSSTDIRHFVIQELDVSGDEVFRTHVKDQILERAQGNFLWVHLAVQRINVCHTAENVEHALRQLPSGMEALYDRMAHSVATLPQEDKELASTILAWATSALRSLTIEEFAVILKSEVSRPLDLQRSICDLCGGFVVVDNDGNVAMIHQTAREYLVDSPIRPFHVNSSTAHKQLYLRSMSCLTDFALRSKMNRKQAPEFLDYAATSWSCHLSNCSGSDPDIFSALKSFLGGPSVLTWIQFLASTNQLRTLVLTSTQISNFALKQKEHQALQRQHLKAWATDLVKILDKFGANLVKNSESIYKLIPPFCPDESMIYQQFGKKEKKALQITGKLLSTWDDSLTRLSFGSNIHVTSIRAAGGRIAVMSPAGSVIIYFASTCEESQRIHLGERVLRLGLNLSGTCLVTYGYRTTKIWDTITGRCLASVQNPLDRPRPHTIIFADEDNSILQLVAHIDEQALEGTVVNFPSCMSLSPDGQNIALGYRGHPLSVWEVEGPELVGHCMRVIDDSTQSEAMQAWGEVIQVTWHPYTGEVIGLYLEGVIFRWHPYHDETQELHSGANSIVISQDGKCLAAGDPNGIVKLYSLSDLNLVYTFASQDPVYDLCFAPDSRRLYDVRGSHGNVWEPDALIRLSESADAPRETEEGPKTMFKNAGRIDVVTALAAQPGGRIYCRGTESGSIGLLEIGKDSVLGMHDSKSFMNIEHIVWSNDGKFVSFSDLSGRVFIQSVTRASGGAAFSKVEPMMELAINVADGAIRQLLFDTSSNTLLVYTSAAVSTVSLASKAISHFRKMPDQSSMCRWTNHPTDLDSLLAFEPATLNIWAWSMLTHIRKVRLPSGIMDSTYDISSSQMSSSANLSDSRFGVERVLTTQDKTFVLVQFSYPANHGQKLKQTLVLDASKIPTVTGDEISSNILVEPTSPSTPTWQTCPPTSQLGATQPPFFDNEKPHEILSVPLPPELISQIETPIAFLSRDRLVFLDQNFWLCSWHLPFPSSDTTIRRPSGTFHGGARDIKRHYFLPSDWISPDSISLCTVMEDGTLLCPRNGDVSIVRCASLRN
ncbi:MAG: hypothetical protein Q9167_007320 [Letrouitia subvulpina]